LVVLDETFHVQLEASLLLHVEPILFKEQARQDGFVGLDKSVLIFGQGLVNCIVDSSLAQRKGLRFADGSSQTDAAHIAAEVDPMEERVVLEELHSAHLRGSETSGGVELDELVDQITARRLDFHCGGPLDLSVVDFGEYRVVLGACEGNLAGDHFEDDAAECPQVSRQRGLLTLDHLGRQVVHCAHEGAASVHAAIRVHRHDFFGEFSVVF